MSDESGGKSEADDLAERFVERCAKQWRRYGLPPKVLASAFVVWGLRTAAEGQEAEEVAAGLERIAAEVRGGAADVRAAVATERRAELRLIDGGEST